MRYDEPQFSTLLGKTLTSVNVGREEIEFVTDEGRNYRLYHDQDCCEHVYVESVVGDVDDPIGSPITLAEEAVSWSRPDDANPEYEQDSFTWTFYKLATIKGYVDIRFYGTSNGYYSEGVDFKEVF
jgi:hypothetical protein